jgi:hypothetical protein
MPEEEIIVIEDTPEPEEQRTPRPFPTTRGRGLRPALRQQHPRRPEYSEYPIPFVRTHFEVPDYFGDPGLYIHIERPGVPKGQFQRPIVHHQDIVLNNLPDPVERANYIFVKTCESEEGSVLCGGIISTAFLAGLTQPREEPILVKWEELIVFSDPLADSLVHEVAELYGKSLPKEDWEVHYFLKVWNRLQELFKLTADGPREGFPSFFLDRAIVEGREGTGQVLRWYREYHVYIELVQFQFRLHQGQSKAVFDRLPSWREVEELGLNPLRLHPDYFQTYEGISRGWLEPVMGLQRLTWEEIQELEQQWLGDLNRPVHLAGKIRLVQ